MIWIDKWKVSEYKKTLKGKLLHVFFVLSLPIFTIKSNFIRLLESQWFKDYCYILYCYIVIINT